MITMVDIEGKSVNDLDRQTLRYVLKRKHNGVPVEGSESILSEIEAMENFLGWDEYAQKWDVATEGEARLLVKPVSLVIRKYSEHEEWEAVLRMRLTDLPVKGPMRVLDAQRKPKK